MVLPMAVMILAVVGILAAVVASSAVNGSRQASGQIYSRQALAIADAAVQIADNRLSAAANVPSAPLDPTKCYTTGGAAQNTTAPTNNVCPSSAVENYGPDGKFYYEVTPLSNATVPCTGWWVTGAPGQTVVQRCITGVGTYHGVTRRVQERVVDAPTGATFPYSGLFSLSTITFTNVDTISGDVAANGNILFNNNDTVQNGNIYYVPPATAGPSSQLNCDPSNCHLVPKSSPFPAPTDNPTPYANAAVSNNDANVSWIDSAGHNFYNASTHVLKAVTTVGSATDPFVIPSGNYYFCEFDLVNTAYFQTLPGSHVVIYIDSPSRPGSTCGTSTGNLNLTNQVAFINHTGDPANLEFDAYGDPNATGSQQPIFQFTNSLNPAGSPGLANFFAPYSQVIFTNTVNMAGAVVGGSIKLTNKATFSGSSGGAVNGNPSDTYYPIAWHQCSSDVPSSDPASGCAS